MNPLRRLAPLLAAALCLGCSPEDDGPPQTSSGSGGASSSTTQRSAAPLLGGTVTVAGGGDFAVISDPERDLIYVLNVAGRRMRTTIRLPTGSQPTRGVEDNLGQVRVVLRGTGQIATVAISSGSLVRTDSVCPEPRGVAWDSTREALLVACGSGELVTMPNVGSATVRRLDVDLNDVVTRNGKIRVSTFRSAQLLDLDETPTTLSLPSVAMPPVRGVATSFEPTVAWRTIAGPGDLTVTVHQRAVTGDVDAIRVGLPPVAVPYYTNPCGNAVVRSAVTVSNDTHAMSSIEIAPVLPVDMAMSPDGTEFAIVGAGDSSLVRLPIGQVMAGVSGGVCGPVARTPAPVDARGRSSEPLGQPVGVGYVANGELLVHSRSPAQLTLLPPPGSNAAPVTIVLEGNGEGDTAGFRLFHTATRGVTCASCHPAGQEDGHVWTFFGKERRTQPLSGGISELAPFHWKGELSTMRALLDDTYVARMGGQQPGPEIVTSLTRYLDAIPAPPAPTRAAPVDMVKGRLLFERAGCAACHTGPLMTSVVNSNVGTGDAFQVPSLKGLSRRAPFMHNGCAKTMEQRFNDPACGGERHGDTSSLTPEELGELTAYLGQL